MRQWVLAAVFVVCAATAQAATPAHGRRREVFLFTPVQQIHHKGQPAGQVSPIVTGDTLPARLINTLLFVREPCTLPIVGAKDMLRAWMALGAYQLGCWYPTQNGDYVFIDGTGREYFQPLPWKALPSAYLNPNGTVTITEPHYNAVTSLKRALDRQAMSVFKHEHEKP